MFYVGIDLHKKTIVLCVLNQAREVLLRKSFLCQDTTRIVDFFRQLGPFRAVMEATASYEWLWELLEPLAARLVLAHPKKMRVIAESWNKNDQVDAFVLAEFLALDKVPAAYRPTARQRQHRALVRQRSYLRRGTTSAKNKIRRILSDYNADRKDLFSSEGLQYLAEVKVSEADRYVLQQLLATWEHLEKQVTAMDKTLKAFAKKAPAEEAEARAVLLSIPQVGDGTVDVVLSELGDVKRFSSAKKVAAYAGLVPGQRESAGRKKELGISKQGSRHLRWSLVEAGWRLVRKSPRWATVFAGISKRRGRKKAIVAVARRLLGVMVAMLRTGQSYRFAATEVQAGLNG
jgi:transposase